MSSTNPIKTIKRFSTPIKSLLRGGNEENSEEEVLSLVAVYSPLNLLLSEQKYDLNGDLEEVHTYTYDENGRIVEHLLEIPEDGISERFVTNRNPDGFPVLIVKFYGEDSGEQTEYTYGTHAQPIAILRLDADGEFDASEELQYDDQSRLIVRKVKSATDGEKEFRFKYDENGRLISEEELDKDGNMVSRVDSEYDEEGKETVVAKYNKEGKIVSLLRSEYDELGRLSRRVSKGFYTRISTYDYDEAGRLTEEALSDENGFVISRNRMEYDNDGRLVEETVYETDLSRSGRDTHLSNRYEYELFES